MDMSEEQNLTWRERQIMDVLWRLGEASVEEVRAELPDTPSYSTVRTLLGRMEKKGHIVHEERELKYFYAPALPRARARESAVSRLLSVFYDGSVAAAVSGLVGAGGEDLSDEELAAIERAIERARANRSTRR